MNDTAGHSFNWSNGQTTSTTIVPAPGIYAVKVTNAHGCFASDTIVLDTFFSPSVNLGNDTFICEGSELMFDVAGFKTYKWNDGSDNQKRTIQHAGLYAVHVTDDHTCTASDTIRIGIRNRPSLLLPSVFRACDPDTFITAQSNVNNFLWSNGSTQASIHVTGYGKYTVTVTDSNFCTRTAELEVINDCPPTLFVPNAFTPHNKDGNNDLFMPVTNRIRSVRMQIYNRWGELIFETDQLEHGWNGTYRNKPAQAGVYVYLIEHTDDKGRVKATAGNVTLLD